MKVRVRLLGWTACVAVSILLPGGVGKVAAAGLDSDAGVKTASGARHQSRLPDSEWPSYNGSLSGERYSGLRQIDVDNVDRLQEVCRVRTGDLSAFQSGLVLVDGRIYVTMPRSTMAIDATNCDVIWKAVYTPEQAEPWLTNRGVAFAEGVVYRGTTDARLLAYDALTGREIWRTKVGNPEIGAWVASAPQTLNGKVYVGLSGGDWGVQGRMFAFDSKTGQKLWQFNLVPEPGEPGAETWPGDHYLRGGGATWTTYALDSEAREIFIPTSNAAPDYDLTTRGGGELLNLYTNSLVVLDADTGALKWWYQVTPHDDHDLDMAASPMLYEMRDGRKMVALASKDGWIYAVDRKSHKLAWKAQITSLLNTDVRPTPEGIYTCPGTLGGALWNGPARDPVNNTVLIGAVDWCTRLKKTETVYVPGQPYLGGEWTMIPPARGWLTALDDVSGKVKWKHHFKAPILSAVTPTAGGVTFAGDAGGNFYAFDTNEGTVLYKTYTGGAMAGGVITYARGGRQFVAIASGNVSRGSFGELGKPSVIIYSLGEEALESSSAAAADITSAIGLKPDMKRGKSLYIEICGSCHGRSGEGVNGPPLRGLEGRKTLHDTLASIIEPQGAMPKLYPGQLSLQDVVDATHYARSLK